MISDDDVKNRLRFVSHKGQAIFLIDFSHCQGKDMLVLLDQVRAEIASHEPATVLTLADFSGAKIDKEVATKMKEVLTFDRPYVKKSAWVGTDSLPHVFYENFKSFSRRDFPTFETREEAMEWLVQE
ncbi:MAG TPA: hypothetical protein VMG82_40690 [Candidatus Sulfotelmatobacter sp.]|nr:hypothetical protein [Candidatus Sulfotelmatobacter sp.]